MKNFILITLFSLFTVFAYGQFYDDCATAGSNVDNVTSFPHDVTGSITTAANTDDGTYTASSLTDPKITAYYSFTVNTNGYYSISFLASGSSPASGTLSVGWDPGSGTCPTQETDAGDITDGFDINSDCINLVSGTTYYISMALENANEGEFTITISEHGEEECLGYHDELSQGDNVVDNNCSQSPPANASDAGTVWHTYTVVADPGSGATDHLKVTITASQTGSLNNPQIYNVLLNDCNGDDVTADAKCLNAGDVLYIESGNDTPLFGDYTINITQTYAPVDNDLCDNASNEGALSCASDITGNFNPDACHDTGEQDCSGTDVEGVWYTFTVSSVVPTFSFTGSEFRVYTGTDCNNLTSLGCAGDAALSNINDNGDTYWVMVYGNGSFTASSDDPQPANDECSGVVSLTMDGGAVTGTTVCAEPDYTDNGAGCAADVFENAVWYSFTTGADQSKVRLTLTTTTATSPVAVLILDACTGTPTALVPTICDATASPNEFCVTPNTTYYLQVSTSTANAGEFNIQVETVVDPANDNCAGAILLDPTPSDCTQHDFSGDNTNACPDQYTDGGCDFSVSNMHSVWYTFTTDANAEFATITTDLANASFALYTGSCGSLNFETGSCATGGNDLTDFAVNPNTTYYLLIGSDTEANFNIGITLKNTPDNNLCADAETLTDGIDGTNACADAEFSYCTLDATSHEVYYTYTNNNGANVDLEITINGNTNTTGNAATDISVAVLSDCNGTLYNNTNEFCNTLGTQFTIECIEDGETIYLVVGSPDGSEGDFGISVNENVSTVTNDECSGAEALTYTPCTWETFNGTNADACFEDFTATGCDYDTEPVVWFEFTATADATSVEFDNLTTQGTGFMGLFESTGDCDQQTEADAGSGCLSGSGPFGPFNITGGSTYLIAVGSSNGEGDFSFDMKVNESPAHDDPCATGFDPLDLSNGVTVTEDNTCAGPDFTRCNFDNTTGKTLFYEYTMTQDADLEITVSGNTAGGPFAIVAYDGSVGCNDESNFIQEECSNNSMTLLCLEAGQTVVIMIGTSNTTGEFGEYDLTVTEQVVTRPANDNCDDAEEITYTDNDLCKWVGADNNESNINACSEDNDFGTACDYSHEEVVWYKFTAPPATIAGSSVSIRFNGYTGTGDLFATLFADGTDCANLTALGTCVTGNGPNGLGTVDPNTTYLIGVGSTGDDGGDYELEIKITSGPPNDDACADMTNFTLTDGSTLTDQTNACSGAGVAFPECSNDDQTNAVFYTFTITAPVYGIHITITQSGSDPLHGTVVAGISGVNTDFCNGNTYTAPGYCEDISNAEFEWTCLEEGTYQLQIASSDENSGTFDITSTFIDKIIDECTENDKCEDARELDITEECEWNEFNKQCNNNACPDPVTLGSCDLSQGPTVWFKVLIPTGASSMDVEIFNSSFSDPVLMVLDGCPPGASGMCGTSTNDGATLNNPIDVTGQDGNYFYIAVSDANGDGGTFDIRVKIDVPPENDSPCETDNYPPFDLGTGGSHSGTTCCAIGFNDDNNADVKNYECNSSTDDDAVWYRVSSDPNADGINVNVTGTGIGSNVTVEVYVGDAEALCPGGAGAFFRKAKCDGLPVVDMHVGCIEDGQYFFIKVSSSEDDCGTFDISVESIKDCDVADNCEDISGGQTLEPVTESTLNWTCLNGCLDLACPDPYVLGPCEYNQNPTVWFQVNTDADAAQLYSAVTTDGSWTPIWSVFAPDPDCSNLINVPAAGSDNNCSLEPTPAPPPFISGVSANSTYYIAVSADPNGEPIDDPNFQICVATLVNMVVCLGPDLGCDNDESTQFKITSREHPDLEENTYDPDVGYMGPFCPGEELTMELSFHYDATQTGNDWLIGFIPKFGPGWDMSDFNYADNPPNGTGPHGGPGDWIEEDDPDCAPFVTEDYPFLCTYTDDDGNLRIYNTLCEFEDPEPCDGSMESGDPLPSGYFWISEGQIAGCINSECSPAYHYGIGTPVTDITWNVTLKVKEFENQDECNDNKDLSISFMTFSDGGAGCWEDPQAECLIDKPQFSPKWEINCNIPPGVVTEDDEICSGNAVAVNVRTDDNSQETIEVTFEDNPNVSGASDHTFPDGYGVIDDILTLNDPEACDPETVLYIAEVVLDDATCEGKKDTIEVLVYPPPRLEQQTDVPGACWDELPGSLDISTICGYPGDITIEWEDDISGKTGTGTPIIIDQSFGVGVHTFTITLTDELGCSSEGEMKFEVYPPVEFEIINPDTLCWGEEKTFYVEIDQTYGEGDYTYEWYWNPGNGPTGTDDTYEILENDYGFYYTPGEWQLCLNLTQHHDNGDICQKEKCIPVSIVGPFKISLPDTLELCEGQNCVTAKLEFDIFDGMDYSEIDVITWNNIETYIETEQEFCEPSTHNEVVIHSIYGCDTTIYFDVVPSDFSDLVILGDTIICEGDSTTLMAVGNDIISYQWDNGETTQSITVSPTDTVTTYQVSATNSSGCTTTGEVTVHVYSAEVPNMPDTVRFCAGYSTDLTAPPGYQTYTWYYNNTTGTPESTTANVSINKSGTYILVVTTSQGCEAEKNIIAIEDNKLSVTVLGDMELCYDEDSTLIFLAGTSYSTVRWYYYDAGNGTIGNEITAYANRDSVILSDGSYYVYVSDGNCDGNTTFTITRLPEVTPHIIPDVDTVKICYGTDTTLIAPPGFVKYKWSTNSFSDTLFNVGKGNYYVTVTDSMGCTGIDSIYVYEYPLMIPKLKDSTEICEGESIWLYAGDFARYTWYKDGTHLANNDDKDSILINEGGVYSVIVQNEIGCTAYDTIKVKETANLEPVILNVHDLCDDDIVVLTASGTYFKYTWENGDGDVLSEKDSLNFYMPSDKDVETIILLVESANGCTGSDTAVIHRYHSPVLDITDDVQTVCGEGSINAEVLDFTTFFVAGSPDSGTWEDVDGSNATHNADWTVVDFSTVAPGMYRYAFTTNTAHAPCNNVSDTLYVEVEACLCDVWQISPFDDVCNDAGAPEINLNLHIIDVNGNRIVPTPAGTWSVTPDVAGLINGNKFNPANAPAQTYTLTYTLADKGNYCTDHESATITVQKAVTAGEPLEFSTCEGTDFIIRLDSMLVGEDPGGIWTEISTVPSTGGAFDPVNGIFRTGGQKPGTYVFRYFVDGVEPCGDDQADVTIIINETPVADAGPDITVCYENSPVTIHAKSEVPVYKWYKDGSDEIIGTERDLQVNQSGTYILRVENGDCFDKDTTVVTILDEIIVKIQGKAVLQDGEKDTLKVEVTGRDKDKIRIYNWSINDVPVDSVHDDFLVIDKAGTYCVVVEDENGCTGRTCHTVTESLTKEIDVPNVFTPNKDGKNDVFFIRGGKNVAYIKSIKIFDRWGELVYSDGEFDFKDRFNHYWDGTFRGQKALPGVYVYSIEFIWTDNKEGAVAGDVTLIR